MGSTQLTSEFVAYSVLVVAALLLTSLIVGLPNLRRLDRILPWYLSVFVLTYLLRPWGTRWIGDDSLYRWLGMWPFEDYWLKMTFAVCLSLVSLAIGYRYASRKRKPIPENVAQPSRSLVVVVSLIVIAWGYASIALSSMVGGQLKNPGDTIYGVFEGTSYWLVGSNHLISAGASLFFIGTRRFLPSLLLATPWLSSVIQSGQGRIHVLGFASAMMAISLLMPGKERALFRRRPGLVPSLLGGLAILLLVFPALHSNRGFFEGSGPSNDLQTKLRAAWSGSLNAPTWLSTTSDIMGFETSLYHLQFSTQPVWGIHYIYQYFLKPIPRIIWEDKPTPSTLPERWFGVYPDREYLRLGLAPGAIGLAFQQWSWFGIVFEFFVSGFAFRRIEDYCLARKFSPYVLLSYAGIFSLIPQLARDGFLHMVAERWLFIYGVPVFLLWSMWRLLGVRRSIFGGPLHSQAETVSS